jgi:hypothetical protein
VVVTKNEHGFPGRMRIVAMIALLAGAASTVAFMMRAGQRTPPFLLAIMVVWVLAPLAALAWATARSARWPVPLRWTLCILSVALSLTSVAIYGEFVEVTPQGSANAARFVMTPAASWLLMVIAVAATAVVSRRRVRR